MPHRLTTRGGHPRPRRIRPTPRRGDRTGRRGTRSPRPGCSVRSGRSSVRFAPPAWTLLIAVVLTVGIWCADQWPFRARHNFASLPLVMQQQFDPISVSLAGLSFAVTGGRRPRCAGDQRRVRHRDDPVVADRRAWAAPGAVGQDRGDGRCRVFCRLVGGHRSPPSSWGQALLGQYGHGVGITALEEGALRSIVGGALAHHGRRD